MKCNDCENEPEGSCIGCHKPYCAAHGKGGLCKSCRGVSIKVEAFVAVLTIVSLALIYLFAK